LRFKRKATLNDGIESENSEIRKSEISGQSRSSQKERVEHEKMTECRYVLQKRGQTQKASKGWGLSSSRSAVEKFQHSGGGGH